MHPRLPRNSKSSHWTPLLASQSPVSFIVLRCSVCRVHFSVINFYGLLGLILGSVHLPRRECRRCRRWVVSTHVFLSLLGTCVGHCRARRECWDVPSPYLHNIIYPGCLPSNHCRTSLCVEQEMQDNQNTIYNIV